MGCRPWFVAPRFVGTSETSQPEGQDRDPRPGRLYRLASRRRQDKKRCFMQDVDAVLKHDPAARSRAEVVLTYPGLHALWLHRAAHSLWMREHPLAARLVSHVSRAATGVEIHPGAHIGRGVFIDHGMGVVIGETSTVGDGCLLYKGVVLGGTTNARGVRHPQIGENVVIGTNATILGNIEVGDGARVGSGSVVVHPVPKGATVVGVPGRTVRGDGSEDFEETLDHASLPDPVADMIRALRNENKDLRERLERLEKAAGIETDKPTAKKDHESEPPATHTERQVGG